MRISDPKVRGTIEKISTNKSKAKGFRKSTEGRAIWSLSADSEIFLLAVKPCNTKAV